MIGSICRPLYASAARLRVSRVWMGQISTLFGGGTVISVDVVPAAGGILTFVGMGKEIDEAIYTGVGLFSGEDCYTVSLYLRRKLSVPLIDCGLLLSTGIGHCKNVRAFPLAPGLCQPILVD